MKLVIQVAKNAKVTVDNNIIGQIPYGFVVLIGVENADTKEIADKMIKKMLGLRIFPDENGKTNLSLDQVNGELLLISQFTLYADCRKGYRPSLRMQALLSMQKRCMNILLINVKLQTLMCKQVNLEHIWKYPLQMMVRLQLY